MDEDLRRGTGGISDELPVRRPAAEDERLAAQAAFFGPLTRRVLRQAGLAAGMRVPGLGSGSGNIEFRAGDVQTLDGSRTASTL
jgi:hypothetical protein